MRINWDENFCLNDNEIDADHRKWTEIANELHDSMMLPVDHKRYAEMTEKTLRFMLDFVRRHFSCEEAYMRKANYPGLAQHKASHARFYVKVKNLYTDMEQGKRVLNSEIMKILTSWFYEHILIEDLKYFPAVAANQECSNKKLAA